MPTVIGVTSEDMLLPVLDQHTPAAIVLASPGAQTLEQALLAAWSALEAIGHLVVVVPASVPPEHRMRLHAVRSLLESDRMALVEVDLPPLAVALLVQQLRQIARYDLGPGVDRLRRPAADALPARRRRAGQRRPARPGPGRTRRRT